MMTILEGDILRVKKEFWPTKEKPQYRKVVATDAASITTQACSASGQLRPHSRRRIWERKRVDAYLEYPSVALAAETKEDTAVNRAQMRTQRIVTQLNVMLGVMTEMSHSLKRLVELWEPKKGG